ncbi:hypothetical protein SETIT_1G176000v2 [Setaria italica]|uniref:Uncharacterized protein n=1 Tax=Setaria italica TaxID=4555 RepID=A0A368PM83_SETIT|nr:hypothetical protein SETIT_1G176000v2 [Setaria italica]
MPFPMPLLLAPPHHPSAGPTPSLRRRLVHPPTPPPSLESQPPRPSPPLLPRHRHPPLGPPSPGSDGGGDPAGERLAGLCGGARERGRQGWGCRATAAGGGKDAAGGGRARRDAGGRRNGGREAKKTVGGGMAPRASTNGSERPTAATANTEEGSHVVILEAVEAQANEPSSTTTMAPLVWLPRRASAMKLSEGASGRRLKPAVRRKEGYARPLRTTLPPSQTASHPACGRGRPTAPAPRSRRPRRRQEQLRRDQRPRAAQRGAGR